MKTKEFNGVKVYVGGLANIAADIDELLSFRKTIRVHLCNAYTFALTIESPELHSTLISAELNLPDGLPLAKVISPFENVQIRGMELLSTLMKSSKTSSSLHVFYGVCEGEIKLFERKLRNLFGSDIRIHTVSAPYAILEELNIDEFRDVLDSLKPDYIWIGLGTPKQDFLVDKVFEWTMYPCAIIPVGAVFDFVLGATPEAPSFMRKIGLEWLFRLIKEPRRLIKRYTKYNIIFAWQVLRFIWQILCIEIDRFKRS